MIEQAFDNMTVQGKAQRVVVGKVDQLEQLLYSRLAMGSARSGDRFPSMQEVADEYGVSLGSARKAMARLVMSGYLTTRPGSGHRVARIPDQEGHDPVGNSSGASPHLVSRQGAAAEAKASPSKRASILLVLGNSDPQGERLLGRYIDGFFDACREQGYGPVVVRSKGAEVDEALKREHVKGLVVYGETGGLENLRPGLHVVEFGDNAAYSGEIMLAPDMERVTAEVFRLLWGTGHERATMLLDPTTSTPKSLAPRVLGLRKLSAEYGIPWSDERVMVLSDEEAHQGAGLLQRLTDRGITGVFVPTWSVVVSLYQQAKDLGLEIGRDFSIVGYGNSDWEDLLEPKVTRMTWDPRRAMARAVELLCDSVKGKKYSREVFDVHLVEGESVATLLNTGGAAQAHKPPE
jgi:DNA-binding LacI/PurR family transcriptional regulator